VDCITKSVENHASILFSLNSNAKSNQKEKSTIKKEKFLIFSFLFSSLFSFSRHAYGTLTFETHTLTFETHTLTFSVVDPN